MTGKAITTAEHESASQPMEHSNSNHETDTLVPATVAQDGHILFSPLWGDVLRVDFKDNLWR